MFRPSLLETPEWAIQVFENLTGLRIVVHDLGAILWPFLHPERFRHQAPCCAAVKARHDWACVDFEVTRLREEIPRWPEGRYHRCHAGFLEWVLPVFLKDRLTWILFAGQGKTAGTYEHLVRDIRKMPAGFPHRAEPPAIAEAQAQTILEALRQLRSRLLAWHEEAAAFLPPNVPPGNWQGVADRRFLVQSFLQRNHTGAARLGDLASALGLGESRMSHLIRELFGRSYGQLLMDMRLRTAASLLRESSLSILEVSLGSGFPDVSHFHRSFQRHFSTTPLKYRRMSRT